MRRWVITAILLASLCTAISCGGDTKVKCTKLEDGTFHCENQ